MPASFDFLLTLLSPPQLQAGAQTLLGQTKPRLFCLLAYLAVEGETSKAGLAALFWPDAPALSARRNLRQLLHRLRTDLPAADELLQGEGEQLGLAPACHSDVAAFLRADQSMDAAAQLALYRGEFLQDLPLDGAGAELPAWVAQVRGRCRARAAALALGLAHGMVRQDRQDEALAMALQALQHDPDQREALHLAMLLHARTGAPEQALALYRDWERRLISDAAVLPAPETHALYRHILQTVADGGGRSPGGLDSRLLSVLTLSWPGIDTDGENDHENDRAADLLDSLYLRCGVVLGRFGAHLVTVPQGGLLAYFGYPSSVAHSALTAVRALAALYRQMPEADETVFALHTGATPCSVRQPDVGGRLARGVLALAAMQRAGSVAASAECFEVLARPHWLAAVKERNQDQVRAPAHYLMQWQAWHDHVALAAAPLLGRDAELAFLHAQWHGALRATPAMVQISGAAGMGKSHLLRAFLAETGAAQVLLAQCDPFSSDTPLHPVLAMFEAAAQGPQGEPVRLAMRRHVPLPSGGSQPALGEVAPVTLEALEQVIAGLAAVVAELAQQQPLLIAVEDVHWADASTLALLERLVQGKPQAALLVLASTRSEQDLWPAGALRINLDALDDAAGEALISALNPGLDPAGAAHILRAGGGHPLFLSELAQRRGDGVAQLPANIRELVQVRLDQLGSARKAAQLAAILGIGFPRSWLEAVAPAQEDALDALLQAGLLQEEGAASLRFSHALLRDAVVALMPPRQNGELAQLVAETLIAQFPEQMEQSPERAALWFAEARMWQPALAWRLKAARLAMRFCAYPEALGHMKAGLALLPELPNEEQRELWEHQFRDVCHGAYTMVHGLYSEAAAQHYQRKTWLAERQGKIAHDIDSMRGMLVAAEVGRGQHAVLRLLRRLLQLPQVSMGDAGALIRLQEARVNALMLAGSVTQASALCAAHRDLAWPAGSALPAHDPLLALRARDTYLAWLRGDWSDDAERQRRVLEAARKSPLPGTLVFALVPAVMTALDARLPRQAAPLIVELQAVADKLGLPVFKAIAAGFYTCWRVLNGERDEIAAFRAAFDEASAHIAFYRPFFLLYLARACHAQGQDEAALQVLQEGEASMVRCGIFICRTDYLLLRAQLAPPALALRLIDKARHIASRQGAPALALRAQLAQSRLPGLADAVQLRQRMAQLLAQLPAAPQLPDVAQATQWLAETGPGLPA
jgi:DNA-binding SARP family transcriptional activator